MNLGFLYLLLSILMFIFGGGSILLIRLELFNSGINIIMPEFFNSIITFHAFTMIFGAIMPAFFGLGYLIISYLIFPENFVFNKLNNVAFILLIISLIILYLINFTYSGGISIGWTMYSPLNMQNNYNLLLTIICIIFISLSSIINSVNFSLTILRFKYKCFSIYFISWILSSYLIIIAFPVLISLLLMILLDKYFFTSFFNPCLNGDVIMYQHIFWFFGHPEVYILILPSFGLISQVLPIFAKTKIFDYQNIIYSIISIGFFSLIVWGHHMFVTGIPIFGKFFFMYCTVLISIPTGIKIFNWLFTLVNAHINLDIPILFAFGFIIFFLVGGLSGLALAIIPFNIYYHGTYFVVSHFHYILVSASLFSILSGWSYWAPIIFKLKYSDYFSKIYFWLTFIFINFIFLPMKFLGTKGMPRRYADYPLKYILINKIITLNLFIFFIIQIYYLYFVILPFIYNF